MLTVTSQHMNDGVILRCIGRMVIGEETAILCAVAGRDGCHVVLDLKEVEAIDAAGIGLLISLQAAGFYLKLMNPTQRVREMLRVTQLDTVFETCESGSNDDCAQEATVDNRSDNDRPDVTAPASNWSVPRRVTSRFVTC